jgi:PAS domain S-box-containing protein
VANSNRRLTIRVVLWVGFLLLAGLLIGITVWTAVREAEARRVVAERDVQVFARVVEENLARSLDSSERSLLDLGDTIVDRGGLSRIGEPGLHELLLNRIDRVPHAKTFFVYDTQGRLFASSKLFPVPDLIVKRDYVALHLSGVAHGTLIGAPFKGAITGEWLIPMTRALRQSDGKLGGVIGLSLDPAYFDSFYRSMNLGERVVSVTGAGGEQLAGYPPADAVLGVRQPQPAADAPGGARQDLYTAVNAADGLEYLYAYRVLENRPIRVSVGVPTRTLSALWWPEVRRHMMITLLALLVAGALFLLILRQLADLERSETEKQITQFTLNHVGEIVVWIDQSGHFPFVNPTARRILGYSQDAWRGLTVHDIFPDYDAVRFAADWAALQQRSQITMDSSLCTSDGHLVPVEISSNRIEYGGAQFNCAVMRDITARIAVEQELRLGEARYRSMIDSLGEGVIVRDRDIITECNPSAQRIFGMHRSRIVGQKTLSPPLRYIREDGSPFPAEEGPGFRALETGVAQIGYVYGIVREDQSVLWVSASAQPMTLPGDHEPVGTIVSYTDFTARKTAEDALRESEARLKTIFDTSPVAIVISATEDGRILYVNPVTSAMNGYTRDEMIGRTAQDLNFWQNEGERKEHYRDLFKSGKSFQFEKVFGRKDGSRGTALASVALIELEGKRRVLTIIQDVSLAREQEAALRESETRFATFFELSPIAVVVSRLEDGKAIEINPAFIAMCGYSRQEVIGKTAVEIGLTVDEVDREQRIRRLRERGRSGPDEVRYRHMSGEFKTMTNSAFVIELGGQKRIVSFFQDISERIRAEEEVRRFNEVLERRVAERTTELATANRELESFSYSVSHDLRSPLRGIDGFSALLVERYGNELGEQGLAYLDRVRRAATRMGKLIDDLLDLARIGRHELKRERVDLSQIARDIAGELALFDAKPVRKLTLATGLTADADPSLVRIVLDNLLRNAWKFTVNVANPHVEFGQLDAESTVFFVRDNGAGFDMRFSARLFGAFQRLHDAREFEGTGIGLAIVRRIVQRHGGEVWAEGVQNRGATFYFTLPRVRS